MARAIQLALLIVVFGLTGNMAAAAQPTLAGVTAARLDEAGRESLGRYLGKPMMLMVFEPECSWCFRQVAALNALQTQCSAPLIVIGVGIGGSRSELREEIQRSKPQFPSYQANSSLMAALGDVPATPMLFFTDESLEPVMKLRGFVEQERLAPAAEALFATSCL